MPNRKKLLIAGGGYADIPLIKSAQKLGFHVITSGNNPDDLGHKESDETCLADFSDPEAMLSVAKDLKVDAICSCANDFSAISSAYVAEQLGLPGHDSYETTKLLHHKDSYRDFALANDIPTPYAKGFSDVASTLLVIDEFKFPIMIKPVDLTGGKGITKIDDKARVESALENAFSQSKTKRIVIEEFVTGSHHGFSAFIRDGKVVFHFTDNEHYYLNQYMVSAASTPSTVPKEAVDELINQSEKICSLLSLKTGIFHVQFILHDNRPVIIEICRRPPGDLYIKLVEHATGVDYASWIISAAAGLDCSELSQKEVDGFYTRHCIMSEKTGVLDKVVIDDDVEGKIIDQLLWWSPGDKIDDIMTNKFGIVFLKFDSMDEMLNKTEQMQTLIHAKLQ
ncbi:MAG: phosphoribosylglycinamide synthetase [Gammaproteobacteria bacterium]|nr:MAG: phosphoribosylglycinamide synthetase [Gammaproteobacteria bacterium]